MTKTLQGLYVSFSGESGGASINNVYALDLDLVIKSKEVLDAKSAPGGKLLGLRGLAFGPDGDLYVAQGKDTGERALPPASAIFRFGGAKARGPLQYKDTFVSPDASPGLAHPYQPLFSSAGDLYVSCQNTNVVVAFHGPNSHSAGKPTRLSKFLLSLQEKNSKATFDPGTFVPAWSTKGGAPSTPVPVEEGGLTFKTFSAVDVLAGLDVEDAADAKSHKPATHSVRGLAFDAAGKLYVADEGADRVTVFNTGGKLRGVIGPKNSTPLSSPVALFFAPDDGGSGKLYIGSPGNQSLLVYDVAKDDFKANVFLHDKTKLDKLSGIFVDHDGNVYTGQRGKKKSLQDNDDTDEGYRIHKWSPKGVCLKSVSFTDSPEQLIGVYTPLAGD
jgi:DNA-binding beta-propeller fold protein YncE